MKIKVELGGGLELLFNKQKNFEIDFDNGNHSIKDVIKEMEKKNYRKKRIIYNK